MFVLCVGFLVDKLCYVLVCLGCIVYFNGFKKINKNDIIKNVIFINFGIFVVLDFKIII